MHPLIRAVEDSPDTAYVLSSDFRLLHTNAAWNAFAKNNRGDQALRSWPLGSKIDDVWPERLRSFYRDAFQAVLTTGKPWEHDYECASPTEFQRFRMFVYPLEEDCVLVVNSLVVQKPHDRPDAAMDDALYRVDGFLTMCAHCRRTFNPIAARWDWVSAYVERMQQGTSHGLCPPCIEFYFPKGVDD